MNTVAFDRQTLECAIGALLKFAEAAATAEDVTLNILERWAALAATAATANPPWREAAASAAREVERENPMWVFSLGEVASLSIRGERIASTIPTTLIDLELVAVAVELHPDYYRWGALP